MVDLEDVGEEIVSWAWWWSWRSWGWAVIALLGVTGIHCLPLPLVVLVPVDVAWVVAFTVLWARTVGFRLD